MKTLNQEKQFNLILEYVDKDGESEGGVLLESFKTFEEAESAFMRERHFIDVNTLLVVEQWDSEEENVEVLLSWSISSNPFSFEVYFCNDTRLKHVSSFFEELELCPYSYYGILDEFEPFNRIGYCDEEDYLNELFEFMRKKIKRNVVKALFLDILSYDVEERSELIEAIDTFEATITFKASHYCFQHVEERFSFSNLLHEARLSEITIRI